MAVAIHDVTKRGRVNHEPIKGPDGLCTVCGRKTAVYEKIGPQLQHARGHAGRRYETAKEVKREAAEAAAIAEPKTSTDITHGKPGHHCSSLCGAAMIREAESAPSSLREQIRQILMSRGIQRDVQMLSGWLSHNGTRVSSIDITKALWSLQKQGDVTFEERKHSGDSILTKIQLTRGVQAKSFRSGESKGHHPVGVDLTDPKNHGEVAIGGKVEREGAPTVLDQTIVPTIPYEAPKVVETRSAEPPKQNEKLVKDDPFDGYPVLRRLILETESWPKYEAAAKALEGVDDEMALEILGKIRKLTPFEEEVIRYVRTHS